MISPFRSRIPKAPDGSLPTFTLDGKKCAGKDFLDFAGTAARQAYYLPLSSKERAVRENLDTAPVFESLESRMKSADTDEGRQIRAQINITKCKQGAFQPPPLVVHSALRSVHLRKGGGNVYLAMCDDNREELDTVPSLLDTQQAERGAALRRRAFQSAVELVETVHPLSAGAEFMRVHSSYIVNLSGINFAFGADLWAEKTGGGNSACGDGIALRGLCRRLPPAAPAAVRDGAHRGAAESGCLSARFAAGLRYGAVRPALQRPGTRAERGWETGGKLPLSKITGTAAAVSKRSRRPIRACVRYQRRAIYSRFGWRCPCKDGIGRWLTFICIRV